MAQVSSFLLNPFALPEWRPQMRAVPAPASAGIEHSHPVCAVRLGGFVGSLWRVCDNVTTSALCRQQLRFSCVVTGEPPAPQCDILIRLATFLVTDAVNACADEDVACRIGVLVERRPHDVALSVEHDGWSRPPAGMVERSLGWARRIAEASGGKLHKQIDWDRTVTRVTLPNPGRGST